MASEQSSVVHAVLNFGGLIVAAIIGAAALVYVSVGKDRFDQQKAEIERQAREQKVRLEQQIRDLEARPSPSPVFNSEAEQERKRLQKDLDAMRAQAKASGARAADLQTKLDALEQRVAKMAIAQNQATPPEIEKTTPTDSSEPSNLRVPRQKLEQFIVEVPRAHARGENATVYVRFTSTSSSRIKLLLADGFLGHNKTFVVDDTGQRYDLENSSGIGSCCFGFAGGDWNGGILDLSPRGTADVTLSFRRRGRYGERETVPRNFTLTAELTVGDAVKLQSWHSLQWQASGSASINVPDITPR
jgi:uncharacterized membrane-anchored protein YhcB (DUF1043 family)